MRLLRSFVMASALVSGVLGAASGTAGDVLVGAPVFNNFSAWDTQSNVPPSGPVFLFADEFSLSSDQFVSTISVGLFGAAGFPATPFNLSLLTALDSASALYSFDLVLPEGSASFDLPINAIVPADSYFLRLTTAGFVGWLVADATQFVTTAGTVADGIWERNPFTGVWTFLGSGGSTSVSASHPGVFSVNGPASSAVPEPEHWALDILGAGAIGILAVARARRAGDFR